MSLTANQAHKYILHIPKISTRLIAKVLALIKVVESTVDLIENETRSEGKIWLKEPKFLDLETSPDLEIKMKFFG